MQADLRAVMEQAWETHVRCREPIDVPRRDGGGTICGDTYFEVLDDADRWRFAVPIEEVAARAADFLDPLASDHPTTSVPDRVVPEDQYSSSTACALRGYVGALAIRRWNELLAGPDDPILIVCGPNPTAAQDAAWTCWSNWVSHVALTPIAKAAVFSRRRACLCPCWYASEGILAFAWGKLFLVGTTTSPDFSTSDRIANAARRAALAEMGIVDGPIEGLLIRMPCQPGEKISTEILSVDGDDLWMSAFDACLEEVRAALVERELSDPASWL